MIIILKVNNMNVSIIRYHYLIRILGVLAVLVLIRFSEYHQHMLLLHGIVIFYVTYMSLARFRIGIFKQDILHIYKLMGHSTHEHACHNFFLINL